MAGSDNPSERTQRVRPGVSAGRTESDEARTPVSVPDEVTVGGPPTAEFEMPAIRQAQPSGEVPEITADSTASDDPQPAVGMVESAPGRVHRQVVLASPRRRPRVRRVSRVLRHVDPWSVFKVAAVFSLATYVTVLTSGVLLWRVADSTGTLANIERWFTQFGWETFELRGDEVFSAAWVIGLFLAVGATGFAVLSATLFNLVSDVVGGVRVSVLEEEVTERTDDPINRFRVRRPSS